MAKVSSILKISGTIGGLTIRQTESGGVAGLKPGPTREQVLTSTKFDVTRRNAGDFKQAVKDATLLRKALGNSINGLRTPLLNGYMNRMLYSLVKTDLQHDYGFRCAAAGDIGLLEGFEFNPALSVEKLLPASYHYSVDVTNGCLQVKVPTFITRRKKVLSEEATHFRIVSCGALVDFKQGLYANTVKTSELLLLGKKTPAIICQDHKLKAGPGQVLMLAAGIQLYTVASGKEVMLRGGAMRILQVARVKEVSGDVPIRQTTRLASLPDPEVLPVAPSASCCYESFIELLPHLYQCG